ncbi:ubiquitin carboxyl-terminal hydrolase isozyme L5 [Diplogelasinospora grovesii]|uniref:Ubiquitin carboxyl-terminal hydrolase n=1 Tax=Diplogelasinospora grovesii TaxID=303347 RepID=A0AAN6N9L4_9PEZI|nr:ubiquitin carboxyl-terminal hydrolase isozyme L5 [Diplogelasinospora grovesii]
MAEEQSPVTGERKNGDANGDVHDTPQPARRSGRIRRLEASKMEKVDNASETSRAEEATTPAKATPTRRHPKRQTAPEYFDVPENILEESLAPWKEKELSEWRSWIEVESDPALFNGILHRLGVQEADIKEVFSIDEESLANIPQPVLGLVFLFQYFAEESSEVTEEGQNLWFANQTISDACGTIALLNIVMNAEGLDLGARLERFKQDTLDLAPPLRGNMISNSSWIRTAHNSSARRMDLLNAALSLQNQVDNGKKKKKRARASSARKEGKGKTTKPTSDAAFHFIAYVPHGNHVWQLDGLETRPHRIGEIEKGTPWTDVARPVIQARMMQYEEEQLQFSLLALCKDRLVPLRRELAVNIRCIEYLEKSWRGNPAWVALEAEELNVLTSSRSEKLRQYGIAPDGDVKVLSHKAPKFTEFKTMISGARLGGELPLSLDIREELCKEQMSIRAAYVKEKVQFIYESKTMIPGRHKDFSPAIHEWVKRLAEKGVLEDLAQEAQLHNGHATPDLSDLSAYDPPYKRQATPSPSSNMPTTHNPSSEKQPTPGRPATTERGGQFKTPEKVRKTTNS